MKKQEDLQLREFLITDEFGDIIGDIDLVSIVKSPATEINAGFFSNVTKYEFAVANDDEQIIVGVAMTPNKKILRLDESTGEYFNCYFSPETIKKCSELFFKNSNHTKTNLEHGQILTKNQIKDVYAVMSWIVKDPENDTANAYGLKPELGQWFLGFKVENKGLWNAIKENGFAGFSIEGSFAEKFSNFSNISTQSIEDEIKRIVFNEEINDQEKEEQIKVILKIK